MSDEISCIDFLKEQNELIQEAASVFPLKADKCTCTLKRQEIYSCLTCADLHNTPIVSIIYKN